MLPCRRFAEAAGVRRVSQAQPSSDIGLTPRKAERKAVRGTASLRRTGYNKVAVNLLDLSTTGFRIETFGSLAVGSAVWITLPGLTSIEAKVMWTKGDQVGCAFQTPLHEAVLEAVLRRA